jgi:uncharacterized protein
VRQLSLAILLAGLIAAAPIRAQIPPSPDEVARYSGLHAAAANGDVAAIEHLIAGGTDINARDGQWRTPLHMATYAKQYAAARELLKRGADANALERQRYDVVTIAAVANDVEMLRIALTGGGSAKNITSPYDGTALIAAAHLGHAAVVRLLIDAGAPLDHVNNLGWTALIEAVILGDGGKNHQDCVRALVAAPANLDLADQQGVTPLAHARRRGYGEIVSILEAAGAK